MPELPDTGAERFTRRVGSFTLGTLISRLFGVIRESVFAYLFGAGLVTDAFNVAFRIPNFFRDLLAESALSAAFVPTFVQLRRTTDPKTTWRFAANIFNTIFILITLLVLLGIIFAPQVVRLIAWGFRPDPEKLTLTIHLTRIMFPFLLFVALAAWAMGILNACGSFFVPAVAPAAFNIISALLPLALYNLLVRLGTQPIFGMAYGVTIGALFQFLIQLPRLGSFGYSFQPVIDLRDPALHQVFRRWVPMLFGLATWQVNFLLNTFLLTFLPPGSVTWVTYAYRIQHLPAGLFGVAIGTVALAQFSHTATTTLDRRQFQHGLNLVSVLTLPAAVLLLVLAVPLVRFLYQHGRFTPADTVYTAQALALYALGIWPAAAVRNCAAGFYALGNTRTPALIALLVVSVNIGINLILMRVIGFRSFPLAASLTQLLNFTLLYLLLTRHQPQLHIPHFFSVFTRTLLAALIAGLFTLALVRLYETLIPAHHLLTEFAELLITGTLGILVYYLTARLLKLQEVSAAFRALIRRPTSN
ncbi:MAG: murein biosynthesis integral membrane protein MurJ [bacterium]|jgi:putative peptidoglycan lipid II flippase